MFFSKKSIVFSWWIRRYHLSDGPSLAEQWIAIPQQWFCKPLIQTVILEKQVTFILPLLLFLSFLKDYTKSCFVLLMMIQIHFMKSLNKRAMNRTLYMFSHIQLVIVILLFDCVCYFRINRLVSIVLLETCIYIFFYQDFLNLSKLFHFFILCIFRKFADKELSPYFIHASSIFCCVHPSSRLTSP